MAGRLLFNAPVADQYPVFVIQNAEVLGLFGWQQSDRKYFSFTELAPFLKQIDEQGEQADKLQAVERSAYQSAILNLRNGLLLYQRLKNSVQPEGAENFAAELAAFASSVPGAATAARQRAMGENSTKRNSMTSRQMIQRYEQLAEMAYILAVPPLGRMVNGIGRQQYASIARDRRNSSDCEVIRSHRRRLSRRRSALFNQQVELLTDRFAKEQPNTTKRARSSSCSTVFIRSPTA